MTPQQLRERGWSWIESAQALFDAKHFDNAAYVCGYAVEFALKARYCSLAGWTTFPSSKPEAQARGLSMQLSYNVLSHKLDELLKLTDKVRIDRTELRNIDWGKASDWWSEQRYEPLGSVLKENVEAQIDQTRKVFMELLKYQFIDRMLVIERELAAERGPFNLFALLDKFQDSPGRVLLMSAWWLKEQEVLEAVRRHVESKLDPDLFGCITQIRANGPTDVWVERLHSMADSLGPWEHHPVTASHNMIVYADGLWMPPFSIIITNVRRPAPLSWGGVTTATNQ